MGASESLPHNGERCELCREALPDCIPAVCCPDCHMHMHDKCFERHWVRGCDILAAEFRACSLCGVTPLPDSLLPEFCDFYVSWECSECAALDSEARKDRICAQRLRHRFEDAEAGYLWEGSCHFSGSGCGDLCVPVFLCFCDTLFSP